MMALALLVALAPDPQGPSPWRVVDRPDLHVGVRPAALLTNDGPELAAGVTLQVSIFSRRLP